MTEEKNSRKLSAEDLSGLDLTPDWARKEPERIELTKASRDSRPARREGRGGRGRRGGDARKQRRDSRGRSADRDRGDRRRRRPRDDRRQRPAELPLKVSFLPERHGLGIVVRRIRSSKVAFALPAIADLFLGKPEYYMLKIEVQPQSGLRLYQCALCEQLFTSGDAATNHLFESHAEEFFAVEIIETESPSGNFHSIARCGVSGELLAPPNHHSYRERIRELHACHCPDLELSEYEKRIEMVQDEEAIEEWKISRSRKTVYRRIDSEDADQLDRQTARKLMEAELAKGKIKSNTRFVIPAKIAWQSGDQALLRSYKTAWNKEKRFPLTLLHALRPALKHMHLAVFKMGGKETFVSAVQPAAIKPEDSISPIREALEYIAEHPKCKRDELTQAMSEDVRDDQEEIEKILKSIHWLVDCGHVIEFTDASLALPTVRNRA